MNEEGQGFLVKNLLHIPQLKDAVLIGAKHSAKLDQPVTRVNVMEVPDVIEWVRPGEFLLTTGYPFRENPEHLSDLIRALSQKNNAALGIKPKRFIDEIPQSAIDAADLYGLPLFELPLSTSFSDVVREVMERVMMQESQQLLTLQARVQQLSNILLNGDGIDIFIQLLENFVDNPVILLGERQQRTSTSATQTLCEQIDSREWEQLQSEEPSSIQFIQILNSPVKVYGSAVFEESPSAHLLLLLEYRHEIGVLDMMTMNWASKLVGFEITNANVRKNIESKYIDQFLQDWVTGRIFSSADLQMRAEACGCPLRNNTTYRIGTVRFLSAQTKTHDLFEITKRMQWYRTMGHMETRWILLSERIVVLMSVQEGNNAKPIFLQEEVDTMMASFREVCGGGKIQFCFGRNVISHTDVPKSYQEAIQAAEVSELCHLDKNQIFFHELGVYILLYQLVKTREAEEFHQNYLLPLLEYDQKHHNQGALLNTVKMFLICNGNMKETAERMFVHYNTVTYRLERLRSELGIILDDADARFQLQLAIKLYEIRNIMN
jgi:purine catabolism regulator